MLLFDMRYIVFAETGPEGRVLRVRPPILINVITAGQGSREQIDAGVLDLGWLFCM
jgi:hypothetical protein